MSKIPKNAQKLALEALKMAKLADFLRKDCNIKTEFSLKQLKEILCYTKVDHCS